MNSPLFAFLLKKMYCNSLLFILMCHEKKRLLLLLLLLNYTFWQYGRACILFLVMQPRTVFFAMYFVAASRFQSCVLVVWYNIWRECDAGTAKKFPARKIARRVQHCLGRFLHTRLKTTEQWQKKIGKAWKNDFTTWSGWNKPRLGSIRGSSSRGVCRARKARGST